MTASNDTTTGIDPPTVSTRIRLAGRTYFIEGTDRIVVFCRGTEEIFRLRVRRGGQLCTQRPGDGGWSA